MSAEAAAEYIHPGDNVGMSGFTGAGYPKVVPGALVRRVQDAAAQGDHFAVSVWTGASTAPELDGALAEVGAIKMRMPYQSDPVSRAKINAGLLDYLDMHLSHVAQMVWEGAFGHLDVAVIEVSGTTADGELIPSSSVGNNKTWIDMADRVILEVNSWQPSALEGMHDVYYGTALPPFRKPIQILRTSDRIGVPHLICPPGKIVAVVETNAPDRNTTFKPVDDHSRRIAEHLLDFLAHEVKRGHLPTSLLPLQSGVGNIANAVLAGLDAGPYHRLTAYTEVIQDGMLALLKSGTMSTISATAFSLSEKGSADLHENIAEYHDRIVCDPRRSAITPR
jgi:succinyl-CoA:acetate CoA-transferase